MTYLRALKYAALALTVVGAGAKLGLGRRKAVGANQALKRRLQRDTGLSKETIDLYSGINQHDEFTARGAHKAFAHLRRKEVA
jgi:hypothetical protein